MDKKTRFLAQGAMIGALYVVLTHLQNLILPGSATWAIQFRLSEALCVLAFFTPAAIWGLAAGCLAFNLTYLGALPLDFVVGTLATVLAAFSMWKLRNVTVKGFPLLGMLMPALFNALFVAVGEAAVLLVPGSVVYYVIKGRNLDPKLFAQ